jgi:hypothetical protein
MTEQSESTPASTPASPRWSSLAVWLPAATFLGGALIGGVVVGVGSGGSGDAGSPSGSASDSSTSDAGSAASPATTVVIPEACSKASDSVQQAVQLLRDAAGYVSDFQPKELRRVLDELETTDSELRDLAKQCSDVEITAPPSE